MKKNLLSLALALVLCVGLASPALAKDSNFSIMSGMLFEYTGSDSSIVIPDGVTWIAISAFENCTSLKSVTIPDSVTSIDTWAFKGCSSLSEVKFLGSSIDIERDAFEGTPWLENLKGSGDFAIADHILLSYQGAGGQVTIPEGVTTIGGGAFSGCTSMTGVTIPDTVSFIGNEAFGNCSGLTSVVLPDSVKHLGGLAFYGCDNLSSVTIPKDLTDIGLFAFSLTPWLSGQGDFPCANGLLLAYQGKGGDVVVPETVTRLDSFAFSENDAITSIVLPNSITKMEIMVIDRCANLKSITIPASVTSIDSYAISDCNSLKDVYYQGSQEQWAKIDDGYGMPAELPSGVALHFNAEGPEPKPGVTVEDIPASGTAYAVEQNITIDGKAVAFQTYMLLDEHNMGSNYVKLRDIAYALNGTAAQFEVEYDGSIGVSTGKVYTPAGGEMTTPFSGDRSYAGGAVPLKVDGVTVNMTGISLTDDNGGGYTYFKLRDLGTALGFNVGYSSETGVYVETGR